MSDQAPAPRPVSLVTIFFIFVGFSVFILIARKAYHWHVPSPDNQEAQNLSKDLAWRATPESRALFLKTLQDKQAKQAGAYGWVQKPTDGNHQVGVVQIPISQAMDLIVQQYGHSK